MHRRISVAELADLIPSTFLLPSKFSWLPSNPYLISPAVPFPDNDDAKMQPRGFDQESLLFTAGVVQVYLKVREKNCSK